MITVYICMVQISNQKYKRHSKILTPKSVQKPHCNYPLLLDLDITILYTSKSKTFIFSVGDQYNILNRHWLIYPWQ